MRECFRESVLLQSLTILERNRIVAALSNLLCCLRVRLVLTVLDVLDMFVVEHDRNICTIWQHTLASSLGSTHWNSALNWQFLGPESISVSALSA